MPVIVYVSFLQFLSSVVLTPLVLILITVCGVCSGVIITCLWGDDGEKLNKNSALLNYLFFFFFLFYLQKLTKESTEHKTHGKKNDISKYTYKNNPEDKVL